MRINLSLKTEKNSLLPFNYEYAISAWIYKTLAKADVNFATWLHDKGYQSDNSYRNFKLSTYSKIQPYKPYKVLPKKGILIKTGMAKLTLSFLIDKAMQDFVIGIFQSQVLNISTRNGWIAFEITAIELLPELDFTSIMRFRARSPIFMSKKYATKDQALYIAPDDKDYKELLINNLIEKAKTLNQDIPVSLTDFKALSSPKSQLLHINNIQIRAYRYDFLIIASPELLRIGYYAGFGGKNSSLGLGFCEVID